MKVALAHPIAPLKSSPNLHLSAAHRKKLHELLVARWKQLFTSEKTSDDFWAVVVKALELEDASDLTTADDLAALQIVKDATAWIERMP